jgi:threonine dehydrogenase-like Zn-dependent dehydrogenase
MLAANYRGPYRVRADQKQEPKIEHPRDAVVKVTRSCICGSDLHLYHGMVPDTRVGMTFGHEFCGTVEEVGSEVRTSRRATTCWCPFNIACGQCHFCKQGLFGNCHENNPQATAVGAIYGYSHTGGGFDGGQAEYVRVPYADFGPAADPRLDGPGRCGAAHRRRCPTGYQAAEMGGIRRATRCWCSAPARSACWRALRLAVRRGPGDRASTISTTGWSSPAPIARRSL